MYVSVSVCMRAQRVAIFLNHCVVLTFTFSVYVCGHIFCNDTTECRGRGVVEGLIGGL